MNTPEINPNGYIQQSGNVFYQIISYDKNYFIS